MEQQKKKVLVIVPQEALYNKFEPILKRDTVEVTRSANATSSLILATNVAFDLILAEYPLPDLSIVDFLGILQAPTLPSAESPILLVTRDDEVAGVQRHVNGDVRISVVPQSSSAQYLHSALAGTLSGSAARKKARLMIQLEARLGGDRLMRVCQTSNLSETGVLIHTTRLLPVGTEIDISFYLPGDSKPIDGTVKVIRHTDPVKEEKTGMGVQFITLPGGAREKLRDYVDGRWIDPDEILAVVPDGPGSGPDLIRP